MLTMTMQFFLLLWFRSFMFYFDPVVPKWCVVCREPSSGVPWVFVTTKHYNCDIQLEVKHEPCLESVSGGGTIAGCVHFQLEFLKDLFCLIGIK